MKEGKYQRYDTLLTITLGALIVGIMVATAALTIFFTHRECPAPRATFDERFGKWKQEGERWVPEGMAYKLRVMNPYWKQAIGREVVL